VSQLIPHFQEWVRVFVVLQRIPNADTLLQVEMEEGKMEGKMGRETPRGAALKPQMRCMNSSAQTSTS